MVSLVLSDTSHVLASPGYIKMEASNGNLQNSIVNPMGLSSREIRNVESPRKNVAADEFELKKLLKGRPPHISGEGKKLSTSQTAQTSALNSPAAKPGPSTDKDKATPSGSFNQRTPASSAAQQQFTLVPPAAAATPDISQQYRLPKYLLITAFAEEETVYPDIKNIHPAAVKSLV